MGGADNICSDKTGTLTKNMMSVVRVFMMDEAHTEFSKGKFYEHGKLLSKSICQNSNATPEIYEENGVLKNNQIGNKTECALL